MKQHKNKSELKSSCFGAILAFRILKDRERLRGMIILSRVCLVYFAQDHTRAGSYMRVGQGFSVLALVTFGARQFFVVVLSRAL